LPAPFLFECLIELAVVYPLRYPFNRRHAVLCGRTQVRVPSPGCCPFSIFSSSGTARWSFAIPSRFLIPRSEHRNEPFGKSSLFLGLLFFCTHRGRILRLPHIVARAMNSFPLPETSENSPLFLCTHSLLPLPRELLPSLLVQNPSSLLETLLSQSEVGSYFSGPSCSIAKRFSSSVCFPVFPAKRVVLLFPSPHAAQHECSSRSLITSFLFMFSDSSKPSRHYGILLFLLSNKQFPLELHSSSEIEMPSPWLSPELPFFAGLHSFIVDHQIRQKLVFSFFFPRIFSLLSLS